MSKYLGKFRVDRDYNDDYEYANNFIKTKKTKKRKMDEHGEVKKLKTRKYDDIIRQLQKEDDKYLD